ncbi:MAG: DUF2188 domain-containing protein [Oscillospiraceae bacterium]|nr:DUF2188 domain-containing protein [Oscillospiraceae bacterium]
MPAKAEPQKKEEKPKAAAKKEEKPKAAAKPAAKKEAAPKAAAKKEAAPKEAAKKEEKPKAPAKTQMVIPHKNAKGEQDGWQVKVKGSTKATKVFRTKAEAEAFAKDLTKKQGSTMIRQKKTGAFQKK